MTTKCEWKDCDFKLDEIYAFDQLLDHIKNIHIHTGHQKCEWYTCDFTGRYARELLDHQVSHMDKNFRPYKCTLCDKGYRFISLI